jgi:four helix bundle protein
MNKDQLKQRTKTLALDIIKFVEALPKGKTAEIIGRQLLRSGTSVGSNYRAARRGRSSADFIAKMGIVEEELDESIYWLELLVGSDIVSSDRIAVLTKEADELSAMTVSSIRTAKGNRK